MRLTPTEVDRLTIFTAAELARRRRAKGWKLTHPEALAIICDDMHEAARGGASYEAVMQAAKTAVAASEVLDGVPELIGTVKIECLFGDGMRVLHVERPIGSAAPASAGSLMEAGWSPERSSSARGRFPSTRDGATAEVDVLNLSDHTIFVSSHFPFFEVNRRLVFDRAPRLGHAPRHPGRRLRPLAAG